jgi:hypothetical protein
VWLHELQRWLSLSLSRNRVTVIVTQCSKLQLLREGFVDICGRAMRLCAERVPVLLRTAGWLLPSGSTITTQWRLQACGVHLTLSPQWLPVAAETHNTTR